MGNAPTCELCDDPLGDGGGRLARLNLCGPCLRGNPAPRLQHRGFRFEDKTWEEVRHLQDRDMIICHLQVTGSMSQPIESRATFVHRRFFDRLLPSRRTTVRADDPTFDRLIRVKDPSGRDLPGLLHVPGFQDLLLEVMSSLGNFAIHDGLARIETFAVDAPPTDDALVRLIAVGLHYMSRYGVLTGTS